MAAAADGALCDALTVLPLALPLPLATRIWLALPADVRMRCREVARAWRDALAEPHLWTEFDLTAASGVVARVMPALLMAAAARADGQLERLYVTYADTLHDALLAALAAYANTLRLLRLEYSGGKYITTVMLQRLLRAAPRQCVVEADIDEQFALVVLMLRNEDPFEALRMRALHVRGVDMGVADVYTLTAALVTHGSLPDVMLWEVPLDTFEALDAVVDAALALRLTKLELNDCHVTPASAVALLRLLRGNVLRELTVWNRNFMLLDAQAAPLLADALRSNCTLMSLNLMSADLWRDADIAWLLFDALTGHASLMSIKLWGGADSSRTVNQLLGALVAADSPLRALNIAHNDLGDAGLGPLVDALPRNTHLQELQINGNFMSGAFVHNRLMPALAANASLRKLSSDSREANDFINDPARRQ